jgi:Fe-S oxidoreductase
LLRAHRDLIHSAQPKTPFNRCGYLVEGVYADGAVNLPRLLVGSEGTLAIFTEATLRTVPLPEGRSVVLFSCASLEAALRAVHLAAPLSPTACDLLERRLVSLTRSASPMAEQMVPANAEALVLIEFEAPRPAEAQLLSRKLIEQVHCKERLTLRFQTASDPAGVSELWQMRESALPSLYGLGRGARPVAFVEDVGVPPELLGQFLTRVQELLQVHEMTASYLVHAAAGQVHIRPFLDLSDSHDTARLHALADALYTLVLEFGGTISTQHGTGLARTPWVARQYGPLVSVFRALKSIWDPKHLLNPGKIVTHEHTGPLEKLRRRLLVNSDSSPDPRVPLLVWNPSEIGTQVESCNGCGHCRLETSAQRMCPLFHVTHSEHASPRAKANLLRRVLTDPDPKRVTAADVRAVAELCINCKMCASECPARVNIPKLMLETKAAHFDEHGLDRSDWVLARMEGFARIGSRFAMLINPMLENRIARWLVERIFGVSRKRRMPPFAWRSFLEIAQERGWTKREAKEKVSAILQDAPSIDFPAAPATASIASKRVAYFVDVFANYNDPSIAEATVAVLKHNGIDVHVPPLQWGCGVAPLAKGDVETAREYAQQNLRVLAELARDGWQIVCSEPTAALMLSHDYLDLLDDPDAAVVGENTIELTTFLWSLHERGELRTDFSPIPIGLGHHVPCHVKALRKPPRGPALLELIPQLRVHTIDVSCSGMAGVYGLERDNYQASLEAGAPMFAELSRPRVLLGSSECSACRMQMEEGTGKRAFHPVQYLALAYGLMPELAHRLRKPLVNGVGK